MLYYKVIVILKWIFPPYRPHLNLIPDTISNLSPLRSSLFVSAGVARIGLLWKRRGRGSCTRAHTPIWLISSKLRHFVRGVHSRFTHARTRRLNLGLERHTYSEAGYINPFSIYSLSNYILVSAKKVKEGGISPTTWQTTRLYRTSSKDWRYEKLHYLHHRKLWVCLSNFDRIFLLY